MKPHLWIKIRKQKDKTISESALVGLIKILSISKPIYIGTDIEIKTDNNFFWINVVVQSKKVVPFMEQQAESFSPNIIIEKGEI